MKTLNQPTKHIITASTNKQFSITNFTVKHFFLYLTSCTVLCMHVLSRFCQLPMQYSTLLLKMTMGAYQHKQSGWKSCAWAFNKWINFKVTTGISMVYLQHGICKSAAEIKKSRKLVISCVKSHPIFYETLEWCWSTLGKDFLLDIYSLFHLFSYQSSKQITLNETRDKLRETYKRVR